jgi:hypothetical protein
MNTENKQNKKQKNFFDFNITGVLEKNILLE